MIKLNRVILKVMIVSLIVIALLVPITSYATDTGSGMVVIAPGSASPSPAPSPTTKTTSTPTTVVSPTPATQTKLPQTGIEDYTGLMVAVVVLGASSVFAYIKIRQYKNF